MTKEDFIKLPLPRRIDVVWQHGELITEKAYYDCNITLFLLDNFYVEVFFDRQLSEIVSIAMQESDQILYAYIQDLDLEELLGRLKD